MPLRWRIRSSDSAEISIYNQLNNVLDEDSDVYDLRFEAQSANYIDVLRAEIFDGNAPDVFWLPGTYVAEFVRDGLVKDLSGFARDSAEFDVSDFYIGPMVHLTYDTETGQSGSRLWGVPRDVSTLVLYLNLDLLAESGADDPREMAARGQWNWRTFATVAEQVTDSEADIYGMGQYGWWGTHGYWIQAAGGDYFNSKQNGCALDSEEALRGLTFEKALYDNGVAVPANAQPDAAFFQGKLGMYLTGRWETPEMRQRLGFNWDVVELPVGPAREANYMLWGAYMVSSTSENQAAAWELVQALTSAETQLALVESGLAIPSRLGPEFTDRFLQAGPPANGQAFLNGITSKTVAETPLWAGDWSQWDNTVNSALYSVITDRLSIEQFAEIICDEADQAFGVEPVESLLGSR